MGKLSNSFMLKITLNHVLLLFISQPATATATSLPNASATPKPTGQKSGSQSPQETTKSPPVSSQPFLALPTNPIIIIPYSLIRNASVIPGPL